MHKSNPVFAITSTHDIKILRLFQQGELKLVSDLSTPQRLLDDITAIAWQYDDRRSESHLKLAHEYLRRMALWATALGRQDHWPFFDVAIAMYLDIALPDELYQRLDQHLDEHYLYIIMRRVLRHALAWSMIKDDPHVHAFGLPDPYEPILLLYRRGGHFTLDKARFITSGFGSSSPLATIDRYHRQVPVVALDQVTLDTIDHIEHQHRKFVLRRPSTLQRIMSLQTPTEVHELRLLAQEQQLILTCAQGTLSCSHSDLVSNPLRTDHTDLSTTLPWQLFIHQWFHLVPTLNEQGYVQGFIVQTALVEERVYISLHLVGSGNTFTIHETKHPY